MDVIYLWCIMNQIENDEDLLWSNVPYVVSRVMVWGLDYLVDQFLCSAKIPGRAPWGLFFIIKYRWWGWWVLPYQMDSYTAFHLAVFWNTYIHISFQYNISKTQCYTKFKIKNSSISKISKFKFQWKLSSPKGIK